MEVTDEAPSEIDTSSNDQPSSDTDVDPPSIARFLDEPDEPLQQWRRASPSDSPTTLDADADEVQHAFLELQERSLSVQRQLLDLDLHSAQARQEASTLRTEQARLQRHLERCHTRTRDVAAVKKQARERLRSTEMIEPQSHRSIEIDFRPIHSQHSHVMRQLEAQLASSSLNSTPRLTGDTTSRILIQLGKMSSSSVVGHDDSAVESSEASSSSTEPPADASSSDMIPVPPPMPQSPTRTSETASCIPVAPPPPPDALQGVRNAVKTFERQDKAPMQTRLKKRASVESDGTSTIRNALLAEIKTFQRRELRRANGVNEPNSWTYR